MSSSSTCHPYLISPISTAIVAAGPQHLRRHQGALSTSGGRSSASLVAVSSALAQEPATASARPESTATTAVEAPAVTIQVLGVKNKIFVLI